MTGMTPAKIGLLAALATLAGCTKPGLRADLNEVNTEIVALEEKLESVKQDSEAFLQPLRQELEEASATKAQLLSLVADLGRIETETAAKTSELEELEKTFAGYRNDYGNWIRANAKGIKVRPLTLADGTKLERSTVISLSKIDVTLSQSDGVKRVELLALPEDLRSTFGFQPESALGEPDEETGHVTGAKSREEKQKQAAIAALDKREIELRSALAANNSAIDVLKLKIDAYKRHKNKLMSGKLSSWQSQLKQCEIQLQSLRFKRVALQKEADEIRYKRLTTL